MTTSKWSSRNLLNQQDFLLDITVCFGGSRLDLKPSRLLQKTRRETLKRREDRSAISLHRLILEDGRRIRGLSGRGLPRPKTLRCLLRTAI